MNRIEVEAVLFDLDGVLLRSHDVWQVGRERAAERFGGEWGVRDGDMCRGVGEDTWLPYMAGLLGGIDHAVLLDAVVDEMVSLYEQDLPLFDFSVEVVRTLADRWPLGLASGSPRDLVDTFLERSNLRSAFRAVVYGDEVAAGKPHPEIYLTLAEELGADVRYCVGVEDAPVGVQSLSTAGAVIVLIEAEGADIPPEVASLVDRRLSHIGELTPDTVQSLVEKMRHK